MTSYRFFKMAAIESKIYFRVRFYWWHSFGKMEFYSRTKFRSDISIQGWYKATSGFGKQTAAVLKFYFRFWIWPNFRHRRDFLHCLPNFVIINLPSANLWRHIDFFLRWQLAATLDLIWVILDYPWSAIAGLSFLLKFGLDRIYSFGDIAIFIFRRFGLKLPIHSHFWGFGSIFPQITSPIVLTPKGTSLRGNTSFEP